MKHQKKSQELKTQSPSTTKKNSNGDRVSQTDQWGKCEQLAMSPSIVKILRDRIKLSGYAGATTPVEANVLILTSRLLPRPINGANISQSSSGKTKALDTALRFFPKSAYYKLDAGSEKVLIHSSESFKNKTIIFSEADSLPEDGPGAAAFRAIISDSRMSYEYVVRSKTEKKESFTTKKVEKEGPTNCITTSTRNLSTQIATRMLCMTIPDSAEQTREVMRAIAQRINSISESKSSENDFIALQEYLAQYGNNQVAIPIADELAELIPSDQIRMRRDFEQFLSAIQASALLHQFQRISDSKDRIISTCEDYKYAVEVFGELFKELATESVPASVRDTVNAVERIGGRLEAVTTNDLMQAINVKSRNTINYRVRRAVKEGFLVNEADKGQPYKLLLGAPLPEEVQVLPLVEEIMTCEGQGNCPYHDPESSRTLVQPTTDIDPVLTSYDNQVEQETENLNIQEIAEKIS
jgi:hypothetical protein